MRVVRPGKLIALVLSAYAYGVVATYFGWFYPNVTASDRIEFAVSLTVIASVFYFFCTEKEQP